MTKNNTDRFCITKTYLRANGQRAWGVYDNTTKTVVEDGFFAKAAAQQNADERNAEGGAR